MWNRDTPWRQGQLLSSDAVAVLGLGDSTDTSQLLVIVASHDCDLAQSPDVEPAIAVVVGRLITNKDGNCTHAKNPRKLHIEFADARCWGEFEATSKRFINKTALSAFMPRTDVRLSPESNATFQLWLASRYRRSAFPEEFESRLTRETKLAEKIAKAVKPHGELITGVFFDVDEGSEVSRHGPEDTYTLDITILHSAEPDFAAADQAATAVARAIETAFKEKLLSPSKNWQHIELRSCEAVSESVLT